MKKILILILWIFLLFSCGEKKAEEKESEIKKDVKIIEEKSEKLLKKVNINIWDLDIKVDENYNIVTDTTSISFSDSTPMIIKLNKKEPLTPVILSDKYGEPILYTLAKKDDTQIDITIESTAVVFTIKTSRFFGLKITDYNTLSKRIKSHIKFSKLISELKYYINTSSPCPTNHACNLVASNIAMEIANEIKISDITEKVE